MVDTSKRLKQTTIVLKQTPNVEEDETSDSEEDSHVRLPNIDIHAKIYAYCEVATALVGAAAYPQYDPSVHGRPVYVGQTIQGLKQRDIHHLKTSHSVFDRQYSKQSQYIMVLLAERRFAAAKADEDFRRHGRHGGRPTQHPEGHVGSRRVKLLDVLNDTQPHLLAMTGEQTQTLHALCRQICAPDDDDAASRRPSKRAAVNLATELNAAIRDLCIESGDKLILRRNIAIRRPLQITELRSSKRLKLM